MARQATTKPQKERPPFDPKTVGQSLAPSRGNFGKNLANWLFPAYVLMIALGYGAYLSGIGVGAGGEKGSDLSLFHAINAASLTGFTSTSGVNEFNAIGRSIAVLLMLGGTLFSFVVGGLAMVRILRLRFSDGGVIAASFIATGGACVIGTVGGLIGGRGFLEALFYAVSAFSNTGLAPGVLPGPMDRMTHLLLLPLAMLGGVGITVLMELFGSIRNRSKLSLHARTTIAWLAGVYVVGFVAIALVRWQAGGTGGDARLWLASSSALAINSRSMGLPLEYATSLARDVQWLLIVLMTIGAGSAGTAGGLKVSTVAELVRGAKRALSGQSVGRTFGIAVVWVAMYAGMVLIAQLLLLNQLGVMPADRVFFLAVSAVGNVGLSHDPLSITKDGLYTLSAAMFAGRVVPLLVLWWMADTTTDGELAIG